MRRYTFNVLSVLCARLGGARDLLRRSRSTEAFWEIVYFTNPTKTLPHGGSAHAGLTLQDPSILLESRIFSIYQNSFRAIFTRCCSVCKCIVQPINATLHI